MYDNDNMNDAKMLIKLNVKPNSMCTRSDKKFITRNLSSSINSFFIILYLNLAFAGQYLTLQSFEFIFYTFIWKRIATNAFIY